MNTFIQIAHIWESSALRKNGKQRLHVFAIGGMMYSFYEAFQFLSNICGLVVPAVYGIVLDTFFRASYQLKRDADKTEKSTVKTVKGTEWHTWRSWINCIF